MSTDRGPEALRALSCDNRSQAKLSANHRFLNVKDKDDDDDDDDDDEEDDDESEESNVTLGIYICI